MQTITGGTAAVISGSKCILRLGTMNDPLHISHLFFLAAVLFAACHPWKMWVEAVQYGPESNCVPRASIDLKIASRKGRCMFGKVRLHRRPRIARFAVSVKEGRKIFFGAQVEVFPMSATVEEGGSS